MVIFNFEHLVCQALSKRTHSKCFIYISQQPNEVGIITITSNLHMEKQTLND